MPRLAQRPMAALTTAIFYLILKRERRAVASNLRRVSGKHGLALQAKVYGVFYSFCDLISSYAFIPDASHEQLLGMLANPDRGAATIDGCLAAGLCGRLIWAIRSLPRASWRCMGGR